MDQGILEWSNEPFTENHMKLIQKLGSGREEIHEGKILLTFSFEGPKHVCLEGPVGRRPINKLR